MSAAARVLGLLALGVLLLGQGAVMEPASAQGAPRCKGGINTATGQPCSASTAPSDDRIPAKGDMARRPGREDGKRGRDEEEPAPGQGMTYEREMERQERLAADRRKRQAEEYEREMSRQEAMSEKRKKNERY